MPRRSGSLESLRARNRLQVIDALRRHGRLSRADIARITGLSRSSVSTLVADLQRLGFVRDAELDQRDRPRSSAGRPPLMLRVDAAGGTAVGIEFDHAQVRAAVSDLAGEILARRGTALNVDEDAGRALATAATLVHEVRVEADAVSAPLLGVGVALAGPVDVDRRRLHDSSILLDWTGVDVAGELRRLLGAPAYIDNDANLGALAELTRGAARGADTAVYAQLSSGIGAGLIVNGQLFRGGAGMAGEIGHLVLDEHGAPCRCGRRGCLETVASTTAVVERVERRRGERLTVVRVAELAGAGDVEAAAAIEEAGRLVGEVLGQVCTVLDPDLVVVGGDLSLAGDVLLQPLRTALAATLLQTGTHDPRVVLGELGTSANLLGAVALAIAESEDEIGRLMSRGAAAPEPEPVHEASVRAAF